MSSVVTIGLKAIEFADIATDGTPGTVFTKYGNTSTDSFSFAEDAPNEKVVSIEESDVPIARFKTKGNLAINANIADPDSDCYAKLRGGTVAATSGKKTYSEGATFTQIEKTVRITPAQGLQFIINRASISGLLTGGLGKNQELYLALSIQALKPLSDATPVMEVIETVPVVV